MGKVQGISSSTISSRIRMPFFYPYQAHSASFLQPIPQEYEGFVHILMKEEATRRTAAPSFEYPYTV
jgi:hypothetical protein